MVETLQIDKYETGYLDCHCHLLPGLDDGPSDIIESLEMSSILSSHGFTDVICTPHLLKGAYDNDVPKVINAVAKLQSEIHKRNIPLTIHPSLEYFFDEYLLMNLEEPLFLEKNTILMELPHHIQPETLLAVTYDIIIRKRLFPMIAHPERYEFFDDLSGKSFLSNILSRIFPAHRINQEISTIRDHQTRNSQHAFIDSLKDMGCQFQGNIGSFAGMYGDRVKRRAVRMLEAGIYDRFGTDAHRTVGMDKWIDQGMKIILQKCDDNIKSKLLKRNR